MNKGSNNRISSTFARLSGKILDVNYINEMYDDIDGVEDNDKRTE